MDLRSWCIPAPHQRLPFFKMRSGDYDAAILHAGIHALRHIELALALGASLGVDLVDTLEWRNGFGRAERLAVAACSAKVSYNLKGHRFTPELMLRGLANWLA
jgi:hypothetical protein